MPYVAPIVAHVDPLGYIYCTGCVPSPKVGSTPVYCDSTDRHDVCDICGKQCGCGNAAERCRHKVHVTA